MKTEVCISSKCPNRHECPHHDLNVRGMNLICPDQPCERHKDGYAGVDVAAKVLEELP